MALLQLARFVAVAYTVIATMLHAYIAAAYSNVSRSFLQLPQESSVCALRFSTACSTKCQQPTETEHLKNGQEYVPVPLVDFHKSSHCRIASQQQEGEYKPYTMPHPLWTQEEVDSVQISHTPPERGVDMVHWHVYVHVSQISCIVFPTPCTGKP